MLDQITVGGVVFNQFLKIANMPQALALRGLKLVSLLDEKADHLEWSLKRWMAEFRHGYTRAILVSEGGLGLQNEI